MGRFHHELSNSQKSAERTCPLDIAMCGFYEVFSVSHTADIARIKQKACSPTSLKATEEFCPLVKNPQKTEGLLANCPVPVSGGRPSAKLNISTFARD